MKARKFLVIAMALSLATVGCSQNNVTLPDGTSLNDFTPSRSQIDSVSYLLGINFGSFLKGYNFGDDLNYAQMKAGIEDFLHSTGDQRDSNFVKQFKINPEEMTPVFNAFLEMRSNYTSALNLAKEQKFLAANLKKAGGEASPTGLQYKIIEPGDDLKPSGQDTVLVRYKGTLIDGTVFDEVVEGADPIRLTLNRVIPGWTEGLQLLGRGGKAQLYIPAELGYGERGTNGIEPNSTLIFDVELVDVFPYADPKIDLE